MVKTKKRQRKNIYKESKLAKLKSSGIHNKGIFASENIKKDAKIIQYVGEILTKKQSDKKANETIEKAKQDANNGLVYLFELNEKYDIDGNVPYNLARYINHSCTPNSESQIINNEIWIVATKNINKEEEITYNYGYDAHDFLEHPCKCGSPNCFGFIVDDDKWKSVNKTIRKKIKYERILVTYYSRTGTTKKAVSFLKERLKCDVDEILDQKNRKGFIRAIIAGKDALLKNDTKIKTTINPKNYDLVIIAGPLWAGNMAPAIRKYVYQHKDHFKNVLFICTLAGEKPENFLVETKGLFGERFKGFLSLNKKMVCQNRHVYEISKFLLEKLGKKR